MKNFFIRHEMQAQVRPEIENGMHPHIIINGRTYYQIPSAPDYYISKDDHVYSTIKNRELSVNECFATGYLQVWVGRNQPLHRLKYETFVGEIPDGMTVNHINHDIHDNRLENLELVTQRENTNKKAIHETLNELPEGAVEVPQFDYQTPRNVYNIRNLYYFDNRVYERFDTCYRAINPTANNRARVNGVTVALRKLTRLIQQLIRQQRQNQQLQRVIEQLQQRMNNEIMQE